MWDRKLFSERVKYIRKEKKLSQQDVGEGIGASLKLISAVERGNKLLSMETLISLADYFNVSLDYLAGRSDNPERR